MSKKIQSVCLGCKNTFSHYPHINRIFCSRSCRSQSTTQAKKKTTCQHCNSVFTHNASLNPKFCSRACVANSRVKTKEKSTCQYCYSIFTHHASLSPKFCSRACVAKSRSEHKGSEAKCQQCNKSFPMMAQSSNKYCSKDCYYVARWGEKRPWADCSDCLAKVGFGMTITARLLGVEKTSIGSYRRKHNIKTNAPPMGSWSIWAKRKTAGKNPDKKRTACEVAYEQARMEDIKQAHSNGHTWGYVWTKEKARRIASDKYNSMTPEEKKEHNTRCMNNRKKLWAKNPELKIKQYERKKKWRKKNKNKLNKYNKEWNKNNPGRSYQYAKKRMKSDPAFRALENQRKRFRSIMKSVKNGGTGSYSSKIGCTTKEFHNYMEAKFKPGMSWDNYGTYWHVDHIIPCAAFDHTDPKQVALCWHHSNMQPLEARENLLKSDKFDEEQLSLLINHTNQDT